jgi:threonine/homoserine/homoserine lactone efflux protein
MGSAVLQALQIGLAALVLALSGAMMPGPLLTVAVEQTVRHGKGAAMLLMVGHALLEAALLLGLALGLNRILLMPTVKVGLSAVGGVFLLWMGGSMLVDVYRGRVVLELEGVTRPPSRFGPVLRGALVSLANPYWILWWTTIGLKLASDSLAIGPAGVGAFFLGHEAADFGWYFAIAIAVASGRRFLSDRTYRIVIGACAVFLLYLGVAFGVNAVQLVRAGVMLG